MFRLINYAHIKNVLLFSIKPSLAVNTYISNFVCTYLRTYVCMYKLMGKQPTNKQTAKFTNPTSWGNMHVCINWQVFRNFYKLFAYAIFSQIYETNRNICLDIILHNIFYLCTCISYDGCGLSRWRLIQLINNYLTQLYVFVHQIVYMAYKRNEVKFKHAFFVKL